MCLRGKHRYLKFGITKKIDLNTCVGVYKLTPTFKPEDDYFYIEYIIGYMNKKILFRINLISKMLHAALKPSDCHSDQREES